MAPEALQLPPTFPCWVRAIYSWSGESKRDLGFVEGDLIECLNAGDGSWWMGRLRRDKRMMGLFPSNFVQVIPDPQLSRNVTPLPSADGITGSSRRGSRDLLSDSIGSEESPAQSSAPPKQKIFRKPFQAYSKLSTPNSRASTPPKTASPQSSKAYRKPFQAYSRTASPNSAALSEQTVKELVIKDVPDLPSAAHRRSFQDHPYAQSSQPVSRQLSFVESDYSPTRQPSHCLSQVEQASPPPPPPPPHRIAVKSRTASRQPSVSSAIEAQHISRRPSPAPSSSPLAMTPSPLRDAMNDVMSSLNGMEHARPVTPPQLAMPATPFSPEEFDRAFQRSARSQPRRPRSSMGFNQSGAQDHFDPRMANAGSQPQTFFGGEQAPILQKETLQDSIHGPAQPIPPMHRSMGPPAAPQRRDDNAYSLEITRNSTVSSSRSSKGSRKLRNRRSAYELGRQIVHRTFTTKSSATSSSSGMRSEYTHASASTDATSKSIMSGHSAGEFSATSAGSLARKRLMNGSPENPDRQNYSQSIPAPRPSLGSREISYVSSQGSGATSDSQPWRSMYQSQGDRNLVTKRKSGFFSKIKEAARTGTASVRQNMETSASKSRPGTPKSGFGNDFQGISNLPLSSSKSQEKQVDWIQVRRDINRSNTLSKNERHERQERAELNDLPVVFPVEDFFDHFQGDEDLNGRPVLQAIEFCSTGANLALVDRAVRSINDVPGMIGPGGMASNYLCRLYRSDVQKTRAIFTWVSEKIAWEEPYDGQVDLRRVLHERRASAQEIACVVAEMCAAVHLHCEVVEGHLKHPGSQTIFEHESGRTHFWNAILMDGEWRMMDCSLASASNPSRKQFSSASGQNADVFYFAALPSQFCYTHVPMFAEQQHMCPQMSQGTLLALPPVCPAYFKNGLRLLEYDTSATFSEDLEMVQVEVCVPADTECIAEVESKGYTRDLDGDYYENGEVKKKTALAQAEWSKGQKKYRIKALLPGDEGHGILRIYSGKRGLMHSIKDNVHPLAMALAVNHTGKNPAYDFVIRHPTPHALRQDIYVMQPQCFSLANNNTYVFAVRQHPSLSPNSPIDGRAPSPNPFVRPSSAMSFASSSNQGSAYSDGSHAPGSEKPAKLAIQSPSGKILRLTRKHEMLPGSQADGTTWEIVIKVGEKGVWRGLVLADRSARWCVFAEWECQ